MSNMFSTRNEKQGKLTLSRDPMGEKPLFYHFDGERLFFAPDIKTILETGIKKEIDETALYAYLAYQFVPGERTLFEGIKKLPAGHMLTLESGELNIRKYWDIEENISQADDNYFIDKLRELLEESARASVTANTPTGSFLSGGIDSAAVTALARRYVKGEFHTFAVGFETFSELEYAKIVSQHLDTIHHEVLITADMIAQDLVKIAQHFDEPMQDAAAINLYYLSEEARKYVEVVLAGDGGDEVFGGYIDHKIGLRYFNLFRLPPQTRKAAKVILDLVPGKGNIHTTGGRIHRLASFLCQPTFRDAHLYTTRVMSNTEIDYLTRLGYQDVNCLFITPQEMTHPLNKMLALDCKNLLPEKYLTKSYRVATANSIEVKVPLLDREIVEFAFSIPPRLKIRNGQEKYILRKAVEDLLPFSIINRKKLGFGTPVGHWLGNRRLKEMVIDKLSNGKLIKNYFNKEAINQIVKNLEQGSIGNGSSVWSMFEASIVWSIFTLELWYDVYFCS